MEEKSKLFSVAKYIIKNLKKTTAMKLQKLVYYSQAWNLAWFDVPIFNEDFQAWSNGPVVPELYKIYAGRFELTTKDFKNIKAPRLSSRDKQVIDMVLKDYGKEEPLFLSALTHAELPWKEARGNTPSGVRCINVISKESIQEYYGGLIADDKETQGL